MAGAVILSTSLAVERALSRRLLSNCIPSMLTGVTQK